MNMTKSSSEYFDQVAGNWDSLRSRYFTERVRNTAIAKAYLRPEMVVADIGGGTGFVSAGLAPLVRQVHLVDGSKAMLDVARQNLAQFSNIEFHFAESQSLGLETGSMDAVFANMFLHHCPDPAAAIREMVRILKPGGRLVITDLDSHNNSWMKEEMADEWLGFDRQQMRAWFEGTDLVNVVVDCANESCCARSEKSEEQPEANISVFVAAGTKRIKMRSLVRRAYSKAATGRSCCDQSNQESCCTEVNAGATILAQEYLAADLDVSPDEAKNIYFGCGNPIALAGLHPGEVVLDIGSGGGLDAFIAARKVAPEGKVIGVDMTPAMIKKARESASRAGIDNVEFRLGQAENLPVEDETVDVILSNCVINLVEDKANVFAEAFRVLRAGGRIEISDIVSSGPISLQTRMDSASWAECVSGALCETEYLDLIAQAGFKDITVRRSPSSGEVAGVSLYSLVVSAKK